MDCTASRFWNEVCAVSDQNALREQWISRGSRTSISSFTPSKARRAKLRAGVNTSHFSAKKRTAGLRWWVRISR